MGELVQTADKLKHDYQCAVMLVHHTGHNNQDRARGSTAFKGAKFDQFIASLEQDFGEQGKGKPFEVFCKWFLENDPEWSKTVDKVWLWDDYPNKWQRQDLGTDLVFRDNDGLIWAVQAKCYKHYTAT